MACYCNRDFAWGNHTATYSNGGASTGAYYNPFRYRGYYYDTELGLYYLNSRYYDSNTGRFINADGQLNGGLLGYNQYAYCENNPVTRLDPDGEMWQWVPAMHPANMVYGGGGDNGLFGCHPGSNYFPSYDSSAYSSYRIRMNLASYDAKLGNYYFGGTYPLGGFTAQYAVGNVSVTDDMATESIKHAPSKASQYTPPTGGGGITDTIIINNTTITFGHGGRHLNMYNVNLGNLHWFMANDVINRPVTDSIRGTAIISYNGLPIEYGYFYRAPDLINIGTYKILP